MSEELTAVSEESQIDLEAIEDLFELRMIAIEWFTKIYVKHFDKIMSKLKDKLSKSDEKTKIFDEIRDKHIKQYEEYIENCLDRQMGQLFANKSIADKLVYISANFARLSTDLISVQTAINPLKSSFLEQLQSLEQKIDERLQTKEQTLNETMESLQTSQESYDSLQKFIRKRVLTSMNELDSILQDIEVDDQLDTKTTVD